MSSSQSDPDVLVIEDLRVMAFPCVYARTLDEGWRLLFSKPWREVWFDFDLGLTRTSDNTYPLALRLEELAAQGTPWPIERLVVHTANPPGGDALMAALKAYSPIRVDANDYLAPGQSKMYYIVTGELDPTEAT